MKYIDYHCNCVLHPAYCRLLYYLITNCYIFCMEPAECQCYNQELGVPA